MYNILIVDDEVISSEYICSLLDWESNGFVIKAIVNSALQAMSLIEYTSIDIVLMDVMMPDINGVELSRMIHEKYPALKIIALSGYDDYDFVRQVLLNGASDYILKHRLTEETILKALKSVVSSIESERNILPFNERKLIENIVAIRDIEKLKDYFEEHKSSFQIDGSLYGFCNELFSLIEKQPDFENYEDVVLFSKEEIYNCVSLNDYDRFVELFCNMVKSFPLSSNSRTPYSYAVECTVKLIEDNFSMNLTLDDAAGVAGVNSTYLSRVFHKETGQTFIEYITDYRVLNARKLLRSNCNLKEIAYNCGFKSYNYFLKVFKKSTGFTPAEYLEKLNNVKNLHH